ncbi:MAG: efflux RND transporter periplasmic adaptor subunit [Desulfobacterales bacterium]|nr:efflux RND transporter periplasmic adaptor subunit [Desulfobacterales bacterium]
MENKRVKKRKTETIVAQTAFTNVMAAVKRVKKRETETIVAAIVILAFAGLAIFNYIKFKTQKKVEVKKEEKIPVQVAGSKVMNLKSILEQTGDIRPMIAVDVYPKVPGKIIERLRVEKGDFVKRGALIAVLERDAIKAQVAQAGAAVDMAEANLDVLEKDYARIEYLYKEKAAARQQLDHINARAKAAKAQLRQSQETLKQLEILHGEHKIYAPVGGLVSARYVDRGAMSDTRKPIVRISSEEKVKIVTSVTEKDFPHIKKGMRVEVKVDAFPEKVFSGAVSIITPTIDPATRTGEIEIHIKNKDRVLRSGMFARIRLYLGETPATVIPRDALVNLPGTGNYYVFVIENGQAVQKNIETGISQHNYVEVREGLDAGEQVVVRGQNRLGDGVRVIIENEEAGAEAGQRSGK